MSRNGVRSSALLVALFAALAGVVLSADAPARHARTHSQHARGAHCGVERWSIKTGTDADAQAVDLNAPVVQTIDQLRSLAPPDTLPLDSRVQPTETTLFVVDATLVGYKHESDKDFHLVIADANGNTMIAEIPDPSCVAGGSPFATGVRNARTQFDAQYTARARITKVNVPVEIRGVGFFDFPHGQTGVAPNAIELHPVLDIAFR